MKRVTSKVYHWLKNVNIDTVSNQIYRTQKLSSKRRNHPMPEYSLEELKEWILLQPNFQKIWFRWEQNGYATRLKPSVDRLDDSKPYSFDNIRLITWNRNREKNRRAFYKIGIMNSAKNRKSKV